jgi:hypothetical protein
MVDLVATREKAEKWRWEFSFLILLFWRETQTPSISATLFFSSFEQDGRVAVV